MNSRALQCTGILILLSFPVVSQQLVYRPINPAFGGDTFNYQWLLNSAQAQNQLEDLTRSAFGGNPLDDFEANLNRQILNQLSREIINKIFGEENMQDGSFEFGSFQINIATEVEGINVDIYNSKDGNRTNLTIPYY